MRSDDAKILRKLPLFADLTETHFSALMKSALFQRLPEQLLLVEEGTMPDFLHVLVEGTVELFAQHRGRETAIEILSPAATFVLAAVESDEVYLKSARTLTPSRILMIPAPAVREMTGRDAGFARAMLLELAQRYRDTVRVLKNDRLRTSSERLANWILKTTARQGKTDLLELGYDKRKIASYLGMSAENLSRAFAQLRRHGVCSRGKKIEIVDRNALELFARPNALIDGK